MTAASDSGYVGGWPRAITCPARDPSTSRYSAAGILVPAMYSAAWATASGRFPRACVFTSGGNQPRLLGAADALPWRSVAGEARTADCGHGRIDVRTIKTLSPTPEIRKPFPHVEHAFLFEHYSYGTGGKLLGAVTVPGITSLSRSRPGRGR